MQETDPQRVADNRGVGLYKEAVSELGGGKRGRIKEWKPVYTKVLVLYQKGLNPSMIASDETVQMAGVTSRQVQTLIRDPLFRLNLAKYNKKMDAAIFEKATEELTSFPEVELARDKILSASERAANLLLDLMDPKSRTSKKYDLAERRFLMSTAQDVLDRAGLMKTNKPVGETAPTKSYSPEEIASALSSAKELEQITSRLKESNNSFVLTRTQRVNESADDPSDPTETSIQTQESQEAEIAQDILEDFRGTEGPEFASNAGSQEYPPAPAETREIETNTLADEVLD